MSRIRHPGASSKVAVFGYDTSRFMTLESDVCRHSSWYEALGALTFGAGIVDALPHPRCNGLRGDLEALGSDYRRIGNRAAFDKKKTATVS